MQTQTELQVCECLFSRWNQLERLQLQLIEVIQQLTAQSTFQNGNSHSSKDSQWFNTSFVFSYQNSVKSKDDFQHMVSTHMGHIMDHKELAHCGNQLYIKLKQPLITTPILLLFQVNGISDRDTISLVQSSPFSQHAHIIDFRQDSQQLQLQFQTIFSAEAFTHWSQLHHNNSLILMCNSAKIQSFCVDAKPYKPKFEALLQEEKRKTIAKMHHYYNYLLLDQTKQQQVNQQQDFLPNELIPTDDILLKMGKIDEAASQVLGFKGQQQSANGNGNIPRLANQHPDIIHRYSDIELLKIFKSLGRFENPLACLSSFKLDEKNDEIIDIMKTISVPKANVILELLKDEINSQQIQKEMIKKNVYLDLEKEICKMRINTL